MSFRPYVQLLEALTALTENLSTIHGQNLTCHAGCSGCCQQDLGVFPVEAEALKTAYLALDKTQQTQIHEQASALEPGQPVCPFLIDDRCAVYDARPVICRSHGFPISFQPEEAEPGEVFLDVCPLNFTHEGALEALELPQTLDIDRLNLRLSAINYVYARDELGDTEAASQRLSLSQFILTLPQG